VKLGVYPPDVDRESSPRSKLLQLSVELLAMPFDSEAKPESLASSSEIPVELFIPRVPLQPNTTLQSIFSASEISLPAELSKHEDVVFAMPVQLSSHINLDMISSNRSRRSKPYYPPLDGSASLESQLAGKGFIEFPTFEIFTYTEWERRLADGSAIVGHVKSDDGESDDGLGDGKRVRDSGWGSRVNAAKQVDAEDLVVDAVVQYDEQPLVTAGTEHQTALPVGLHSLLGGYGSDSTEED
jgi:hypothetical protein